jgi:3-oxoacyl-[acyl-carrier-protein] synthase II
MSNENRVVITGMGAICPVGETAAAAWKSVVNGISGVAPITLFDPDQFLVKNACEVKNFNAEIFMPAKEIRRRDRFEQFAFVAAKEAIEQSGLLTNAPDFDRIGVVVSSAIGGLNGFEDNISVLIAEGPRKVSPFAIPMMMSNGASGMIAIDFGLRGPSLSVASACASGADGLGMAWMMIKNGEIDAALAGASDATITQIGVACFDRVGAMSRRNNWPINTPQPFDKDRDGLVMGEGAAVLVLESESHAIRRGAVILAEFAGYRSTADAYHITAPAEDGSGGARAMRLALRSAAVNFDEVDYINAHGTGTPLNDLSETKAIKSAFGDRAYTIPISSTKSMTGHMMGATGALEAIFCAYAVRENIIPPTINYFTPDPDCDLDYVPNQSREKTVNVALSNSFGFGGHNAVLVIKKYV